MPPHTSPNPDQVAEHAGPAAPSADTTRPDTTSADTTSPDTTSAEHTHDDAPAAGLPPAAPAPAADPTDPALADDALAPDGGPDIPNLPLMEAIPAGDLKPTWRGWIHAGTFPVTIAGGIVLICLAHGATAKWASAVFMLTSMLLFGNSALYHRFNWKPRMKVLLKRIDHANIFLLIAGTYTPLAMLALPPEKGVILLSIVWAGALIGIGFRVFWIMAPRWLYVPIYVLLGWAAIMYIVDLVDANLAMMVLVLVGGVLYTAGAVVYGLKRPNPFPGRFGFHEIFHTLTVLAFLCHWTATLLIALHPAYNA